MLSLRYEICFCTKRSVWSLDFLIFGQSHHTQQSIRLSAQGGFSTYQLWFCCWMLCAILLFDGFSFVLIRLLNCHHVWTILFAILSAAVLSSDQLPQAPVCYESLYLSPSYLASSAWDLFPNSSTACLLQVKTELVCGLRLVQLPVLLLAQPQPLQSTRTLWLAWFWLYYKMLDGCSWCAFCWKLTSCGFEISSRKSAWVSFSIKYCRPKQSE